MNRCLLFTTLALLAVGTGCSKRGRSDAPAPPTPAPADARPAAPVVRSNSGAPIDCGKLLPKPLREKLFPGMQLTQAPLCADCPEQCKFTPPGTPFGPTVLYDCRGTIDSVSLPTMEAAGWKTQPGVGKLAFVNAMQVTFWDETGCQVTVTEPGAAEARLVEIAKAVEVPLTPAAIGR
jgi:hypothetical protein